MKALALRRLHRLIEGQQNDRTDGAIKGLGLLEFIPRVSPRYERPDHLADLAALFERAETEEVNALVSVPPQHAKTETILHAIARFLLRHPDRTVAYVSYNADVAHAKSRTARDYAIAAGVELRKDSKSVGQWRTPQGGGLIATGIGGPLTSYGVQLLIVDDPHKNREEAESSLIRGRIHEWLTSVGLTRLHPGSSVIVVHTRWHEDDLIGRLSKEKDDDQRAEYEVLNLPAVNDNGDELWARRHAAFLAKMRRRVGEYDWWALYMGQPRPKGGALFQDVHHYTELPKRYRVAIGVDLAFTEDTKADFSVAVVMAECDGVFYVLKVLRKQVDATAFAKDLRMLAAEYPGAPMVWHIGGGGEKGVVSFMRQQGVPLIGLPAVADKYVRATPVAAAWNEGLVRIPAGTEWGSAYVGELSIFSGKKDKKDDQVDATSSAHAVLAAGVDKGASDSRPVVRRRSSR